MHRSLTRRNVFLLSIIGLASFIAGGKTAFAQYSIISKTTTHNYVWIHTANVQSPPTVVKWGGSGAGGGYTEPPANLTPTNSEGGSSAVVYVGGFNYGYSEFTDTNAVSTVVIRGPDLPPGINSANRNVTLQFTYSASLDGSVPYAGPYTTSGTLLGSTGGGIFDMNGNMLASQSFNTLPGTKIAYDSILFTPVTFSRIQVNGVWYSQGTVQYKTSVGTAGEMDMKPGYSASGITTSVSYSVSSVSVN